MGSISHQEDWQTAKLYFNDRSLENNIVHKMHRYTHHAWNPINPLVKRSFIHLNGYLYEIQPGQDKWEGKIAGEGTFGRVKYIYNEAGTRQTVKIDNRYLYAHYDLPTETSSETLISKDVGLFLNVGFRTKPTSYTKKRTLPKYFRYAIMPDLGEALSSVLKHESKKPDDKTRLNLAFQACFLIYKLHSGLASASHKKIVHGDIKPNNFYYDVTKRKLSLGDYGLSQYEPIEKHALYFNGTSAYLPFVTKYEDIKRYQLNELDIFALKRTIYYPDKRRITDKGLFQLASTKPDSILNNDLVKSYDLLPYFNTREGDGDYHSPLFLATTILLSEQKLNPLIKKIEEDEIAQKALLVLHFADGLNENTCLSLLENVVQKKQFAALLPIAEDIKPALLHEALSDINTYQALMHILPLPAKERLEQIEIFNQRSLLSHSKSENIGKDLPQPLSPDFISYKNSVLNIIRTQAKKANTDMEKMIEGLVESDSFDSLLAHYSTWIMQINEEKESYFLILLFRAIHHLTKDTAFATSLSKRGLENFKGIAKSTISRMTTPMNTTDKKISEQLDGVSELSHFKEILIKILNESAIKTDKLNAARGNLFFNQARKHSYKLKSTVFIDSLKNTHDFSTLLEATSDFLLEIHHNNAQSLLITLNDLIHTKLKEASFIDSLSETELKTLLEIANATDRLDGNFYAQHPSFVRP
jgi:serine/threonine protein kinase